ncbi:MAG: DMT family transporter [Elioraea sp.]|nr:DMT family transporter [Elioraea sp.]
MAGRARAVYPDRDRGGAVLQLVSPPEPPEACGAGPRAGGRPRRVFPWAALLLALASLFWSGNFTLGRAVRGEVPPVALALLRWLLAALVLLPLVWRDVVRRARLIRCHAGLLAGLGVAGMGSFNTLSYIALTGTEALNGSLVVSLTPLMIVLAAFLLDGERPSRRRLGGVALSLAGVAVIAARGDVAALLALRLNPWDGLMLVAVFGWAVYTVLLRRLPPGAFPPLVLLAVTTLFGLAVLLPSWVLEVLLTGALPRADAPTAGAVVYTALFASLGAYLCWNRGVALIGPAAAGPFLHLQPVFGVGLAVLLLGERPEPFHAVGFGLILVGLWLGAGGGGGR